MKNAAVWAVACVAAACVASSEAGGREWSVDSAPLRRISALEDARTTGDGELIALLASEDDAVRVAAARALGRMPFPEEGAEVTRALLEALFDEDPDVRAEAAFALGMRGDASAGDKLVFVALDHHEADREGLVRARAIEAASKLDRPDLRERLLDGLLDGDPRVRLETAQGASRWPTTEATAGAVNARLVEHLATEKDGSVITYTLFALERRKANEALEVFADRAISAPGTEQRLFAVRGLRAAAGSATAPLALCAATQPKTKRITQRITLGGQPIAATSSSSSNDWRVRCEALIGLASFEDDSARNTLAECAFDANPHVARCAWEALGAHLERSGAVEPALIFAQSPSTSVRAAHAEALARGIAKRLETIAFPGLDSPLDYPARANLKDSLLRDAYSVLQRAGADESFVLRCGAARAFAHLPSAHAEPWLAKLTRDPHLAVAGAAIEGLAKHPTPTTRALLHELLAHKDSGLRLAAVTALIEIPDPSDVAPLARCFDSATGDGSSEIRFNALRAGGKSGGDEARKLVARGLFDASPFVRRVAREEATKLEFACADIERSLAFRSPTELARASRASDLGAFALPTFVAIETSRGAMTFELFPQEAPHHVRNFLALAARGHYDGLTFHRVVPDFVIQGGDYRGDGNGGGTWRGADDSLRHEIGPRKYVRGSLGMPRNEDPDSGGSQFFVTHRATPHLDGRYTIFGELRDGFEVLDAIEVGDVITSVRVVER